MEFDSEASEEDSESGWGRFLLLLGGVLRKTVPAPPRLKGWLLGLRLDTSLFGVACFIGVTMEEAEIVARRVLP
jgi:hypothetical protein